jgi:hypothetical protein
MKIPTYDPEESPLSKKVMEIIKKKIIKADTLARILPSRETGL